MLAKDVASPVKYEPTKEAYDPDPLPHQAAPRWITAARVRHAAMQRDQGRTATQGRQAHAVRETQQSYGRQEDGEADYECA